MKTIARVIRRAKKTKFKMIKSMPLRPTTAQRKMTQSLKKMMTIIKIISNKINTDIFKIRTFIRKRK